MKLDIGIASYNNPEKLNQAISSIRENTHSDWRLLVVDNNSTDRGVEQVLRKHAWEDDRVIPMFKSENTGYAGAVNDILNWAETEYVCYSDNDAYVNTPGWDIMMANTMGANPEVGMIFPMGRGAYPIVRPGFTEVLWSVGCFWMLRRESQKAVGLFDETLGHQEEVDYQTRMRLEGLKVAIEPEVYVQHDASSSTNPEAEARINAGVVNWVNKWVKYFCGKHMDYFSNNVLRFEDWPPNTLYLEEYYLQIMPDLNANPEQVVIDTRTYDLIKVPRCAWSNAGRLYLGRII